jgi:PPOX class probable FMN-dependent enzyme
MSEPFKNVVSSIDEVREIYRMPATGTKQKVLGSLDQHARAFIAASPFVLVGTTSADGTGDVSPKGGPAGFVVVLDDQRIAIPDLSGNNLLDSITNVVTGSGIGLIFLVPGVDETLRVNGHACLTTDPEVLDACAVKDRRPKAAIGVVVTQQYMHCAKAFRRSELWRPETWPDRSTLPTLGCILVDQIPMPDNVTAALIDANLETNYAETLWEPGGEPRTSDRPTLPRPTSNA